MHHFYCCHCLTTCLGISKIFILYHKIRLQKSTRVASNVQVCYQIFLLLVVSASLDQKFSCVLNVNQDCLCYHNYERHTLLSF